MAAPSDVRCREDGEPTSMGGDAARAPWIARIAARARRGAAPRTLDDPIFSVPTVSVVVAADRSSRWRYRVFNLDDHGLDRVRGAAMGYARPHTSAPCAGRRPHCEEEQKWPHDSHYISRLADRALGHLLQCQVDVHTYCVEKTEIPPFGYDAAQFAQPAGEVADEYGTKTLWSFPLTATEWALLPVAS